MDANKIKRLPLPSNWRTIHPTTYLHKDDLINDEGKFMVVPVTTERIELHEIENPKTFKKEKKLVAYFKDKQKGLILNATMNKVMQEISGTRDPRKWQGIGLELFIEPNVSTPQGRQDVPRIRAAKTKANSVAMKLSHERGQGFDAPVPLNLEELPEEELDKLMEEVEVDT